MKNFGDQDALPKALLAWLAFGIIVPLVFTLAAWRAAPPMLNPDSAMGFIAWESHKAGAPWNHIRAPDPEDIARDRDYFLSWWSPAQHDIPGIFKFLGANWGQSIALTCLLSTWFTIWGCWQLARRTGGTPEQAAWFGVISVLQWHTLFPFGHFRGGDVLLGAATPWLMVIAWETRRRPISYLVSIPILILGGQYLKLSAILITGPLLLLGWISNIVHLRKHAVAKIGWAIAAPAIAAGSWWLLKLAFLDRGANPGSAGTLPDNPLALTIYALGSPLLAATGAGSLIGHAYYRLGLNVDTLWREGTAVTLPGFLAGWWLTYRSVLSRLDVGQRCLVLGLTGASSLMLATLFLRGAPVAIEDRFLRPASTVLLLALTLACTDGSVAKRRTLKVVALMIAIFGLGTGIQRTYALLKNPNKGQEGILQQDLPPAALAYLKEIDSEGLRGSKLIYVPHATLALQVRNHRVLVTDDLTYERDLLWHGKVPQIVLAIPEKMQANGAGSRIRSRFVNYTEEQWSVTRHGEWWFWKAESAVQ